MNFIFLLVFAITPGIAIAVFIYIKDKHEPEPIRLVLLSFLLGILSFGINLKVAVPLNKLLMGDAFSLTEEAIHAFFIVGLLEEFCKFALIRGILYRNKNFNEPLDAIVYAVMVGMGFATAENVFYAVIDKGGAALIRIFSALPAHAMFAILMGYLLGKAKFTHKRELYYSVIALLVATLFHGTYDYFLFISFVPGIWLWSVVSLLLAFVLSRKAIQLHQHASPFSFENRDGAGGT